MQAPVQITFRGIPPSDAIEERIHEEAAKLERIHDNITACRVVMEAPHRNRTKGNLYHTAIYLTVPGGDIEVTRDRNDVTPTRTPTCRSATRSATPRGNWRAIWRNAAIRSRPIPRALSNQMEPFDRSYLASWQGALLMAMPHIGKDAQRRHGAR